MNVRWTALFVAVACLATAAVNAQEVVEHGAHSSSVIRPIGYGLWDDYDGGCGHRVGLRGGCCGPIGCPYGLKGSCGCGGCSDGCNYRIACGLPLVINRITRPLDCLFPCRPKLFGCYPSGWGGCSPCYDPSCGGGCPRPIFTRKFGGFGGCAKCDSSVACNLDCSCGTPAVHGRSIDVPAPSPMPESKANPFQDDVPEPMPTDARRATRTPSHFSKSPTPARRPVPVNRSAAANPTSPRVHVAARPVQTADHASTGNSQVRQASAEGDVINDYTRARIGALQPVPSGADVPLNPLR